MHLLVNPWAASVTTRSRQRVRAALATSHDVTVAETEERDHATELAREAVAAGAEAVAVLAGDGTLNEAANGVLGSEAVLAALPGGSTNVFARTIGVPRDPTAAARSIAEALSLGSVRRIGLGSVNGRAFLFHVGMGFDAAVVEQVERRPALKRRLGQAFFVHATLATWLLHYDRGRPRFTVQMEGAEIDDGYFAVCLNTNPYTFLGPRPLQVAPDATLERGLSMFTLRSLDLGTLLSVTASVLGDGEGARAHPRTDYRADLTELAVIGHGSFPYQVDGDYLGEVEELLVRYQPDALAVAMPVVTP
ncbi:MAG: diacylglycerol/lipid kinase family protein [Acidimicrobiales bacterium]